MVVTIWDWSDLRFVVQHSRVCWDIRTDFAIVLIVGIAGAEDGIAD